MQINLARVRARLEYLRLLNWKVAWSANEGAVSPADASATKVFGTEFFLEAYGLLMEIIGPESARRDEHAARIRDRLESTYQGTLVLTFGGGTNEVQRDLVSMFGLGFPRAKR